MPTELSLVPLTLLDAVNALMRSVGLTQIDALLDTNANVDSQNAFGAISRANSKIQSQGWHGNTEAFTLIPDFNGNIQAAPNWLRVRPARTTSTGAGTSTWANSKLTVRAGKLYDLKAHTFIFKAGSKVDLEIVQALAFEDLPEALRWYITCRGGREFAVGTYPSSGTFRFTEAEEQRAKLEAEQEDQMLRDETLPESSPYFARMRRR